MYKRSASQFTININTSNSVDNAAKKLSSTVTLSILPVEKSNNNFKIDLEIEADFNIINPDFGQDEATNECITELYPHLRAIIATTSAGLGGQTIFLPPVSLEK